MIDCMIAHTGRKLLLRLASIQDVLTYLDSDSPTELQQSVVKKTWHQLHSLQERGQTHSIVESLNQRMTERVQQLVETVETDSESLLVLQQQLNQCSVLMNKFVTFPAELQSSFTHIISHLLVCLRFLTGASTSTLWAEELNNNSLLKQSTCDCIFRFLIGLLAAYPKNDSFHELYEGELWDVIILLAPISITTNIESCWYLICSVILSNLDYQAYDYDSFIEWLHHS